ncbi:hypothetical protein BLNAU_11724 [Blattamonas nauphoetae]|uniref:Uncharacterized protein n=1 Tax=Blattamonas nauphoetae TaxID=2049346 RepID=A0ABQ9WXE2_9EUKA|nr:hypothetical protein BLNAU_22412 [Blattamonas nauphoetae]KAK2953261.1 hypothetical protein BLNAU_11724 [Blattamonas nauphoetae]
MSVSKPQKQLTFLEYRKYQEQKKNKLATESVQETANVPSALMTDSTSDSSGEDDDDDSKEEIVDPSTNESAIPHTKAGLEQWTNWIKSPKYLHIDDLPTFIIHGDVFVSFQRPIRGVSCASFRYK